MTAAAEMTLPAATYLVAFDTRKNKLAKKTWIDYLVRGAALGELVLSGHLAGSDGQVIQPATARPADPVLSSVLDQVRQTRRPTWKRLLRANTQATLADVERQLAGDKAISMATGGSVAGPVTPTDPAAVESLQHTVRAALTGRKDPASLTDRDAALAALAAIVPLPTVLSRREQRKHKAVIDATGRRAAAAHPAFQALLSQMRRTRGRSFSAGGPVH